MSEMLNQFEKESGQSEKSIEDRKKEIATSVVYRLQQELLAAQKKLGSDFKFDDFSERLGAIEEEVRRMLGIEQDE